MKKDITVSAEPRVSRGKNEARRLRQKGMIPAVVYGAYQAPQAVAVSPREVERILHSRSGHNTIFNIGISGGENTPVMLVDYQYDPVRDSLLHVDLKRIDLTRRLTVSVPVEVKGEPQGVKVQGGLLEIITREVAIECLPDQIPETFTIDVTELLMGQSIRAADIPMPDTLKLVSVKEAVIAHVVALRQEEVAAPAEAAPEAAPAAAVATSEPEVIKKGKKEEEAAEAETKGKKK